MKKIKIIFMGTPEFAVPALKKLIENEDYKIMAVITAPDKPVGRKQLLTPPPVKVLAEKYKISILQPEKIHPVESTMGIISPLAKLFHRVKNSEAELKNLKPDLMVVCAYGQIIPKSILDIPKYGSLNIHPSLLPKYRGPSPIQYAILNGEKETGVTIMLVDGKMDHGPILTVSKLKIGNLASVELSKKLAVLGADLLIETIPEWINKKIKAKPQDDSLANYTKIIKKEDGKIDWQKSAQEIERQIRAFYPWPGTFSFWQLHGKEKKLKLKIVKAYASLETANNITPGQIFLDYNKKISITCNQGHLILQQIQLEGKKEMSVEDFLKGHPKILGIILKN